MILRFGYSESGPRKNNEDSYGVKDFTSFTAACIADGVGGTSCGKLASESAIQFFLANITDVNTDLTSVVKHIHHEIKKLQDVNIECSKMASTFTACLINKYLLRGVHVGDTRLCVLRGSGIKQLTESHTEVQRLYKAGKITLEDMRWYPRKHFLESAVGIHRNLIIQSYEFVLNRKDRILLTTDGVHEVVSKVEFRDLSLKNDELKGFGESVIDLLRQKKLKDNVTFIALEIE